MAQLSYYDYRTRLMDFAGISFCFNNYHRLDMAYTSFMKKSQKYQRLTDTINKGSSTYKDYSVGLGIIAKGEESQDISILTSNDLARDLKVLSDNGIKEAVIYRLGGLSKSYIEAIKEFVG